MTWYVVVTRDRAHQPIKDHPTLDGAGNQIYRERAFDRWTVMAYDGTRRAGAPMRELNKTEKSQLERLLYPSLFE